MRRDHDHQLVLALVQAAALEQLAEDRDVADTGYLLELLGDAIVHQTGDRVTLSVGKIHFGLEAIRCQSGDDEPLQSQSVCEIQRANLGLDLQVDQPIGSQSWREVQTHSELFELNGDACKTSASARGLEDREGKLAAGQKAGVFAGFRHQVGFGEDLQYVLFLQGFDGGGEIDVRPEDENVEQIAETNPAANRRSRAHTIAIGKLRRSELLSRNRTDDLRP